MGRLRGWTSFHSCKGGLKGNTMKLKLMVMLLAVIVAGGMSGCSMGMMPEGPSASQVKEKVAAMPPDQQIAFYQNSPMSPAKKAAKIAEIKAKYGLK